jgi:hypothetical protein
MTVEPRQVQHTFLHFILVLHYIPTVRIYAGIAMRIPDTVPFPKLIPAGPEGIPDGTYTSGNYPDI